MQKPAESNRLTHVPKTLASAILCALLCLPLITTTAQGPAPAPPIPVRSPAVSGMGCLIQTDFVSDGKRNFELVVLEGSSLVHYWRANDRPDTPWRKGDVITSRAIAPGCILQSDYLFAGHGNLEVVVPEAGGALVHYWRVSGDPHAPWMRAGVVTTGVTGGACLLQSDYTANGHRNFEVMVQKGDQLWHHWHWDGLPADNWPGALVTTGVTKVGPGCLIQSDYTSNGHRNFEVVVQKGNALWHHWRWDGMPSGLWPGKAIVFDVTAPGCLIASDFKAGNIRNFEVVVQKGNVLWHHWRWDGMADGAWPGAPAVNNVTGAGCFVQGDFQAGGHGNFELAVPMQVSMDGALSNQLVHFFKVQQPSGLPWQPAQTISFQGRSEKVCMLTGETDWESGVPTVARTESQFGLGATDLGYPVEHQGDLALLFGDSWPTHVAHAGAGRGERAQGEIRPADDAVGWVTTKTPPTKDGCLDLHVNQASAPLFGNVLLPPTVTGPLAVKHGYFNVPSGGVSGGASNGGGLWAFFWTNHCQDPTPLDVNPPSPLARPAPQQMTPQKQDTHTQEDLCPETDDRNSIGAGVLARSEDNGQTFNRAVPLPPGFVYATAVDATAIDTLPAPQRLGTYVFAVPRYRASVPYLAYAPPGRLGDPDAWLFLIGRRADGQPVWTSSEVWRRGRQPQWSPPGQPELFAAAGTERCVGEFSVTWNSVLNTWLMLYNCGSDILARVARAPWGPWSAATVILNTSMDGAPCRLLMRAGGCGNQERYHGQNNPVPGGFYAPFVLERYTTAVRSPLRIGRRAIIYWLLSTWDPYQVVVMRTTLDL